MPDIKIPEFNTDLSKAAHDLADVAKDATYVVIGAGVLGFQKAQVQRQELSSASPSPGRPSKIASRACGPTSAAVHTVDTKVEDLIARIEAAFVPLEDRLPAQARDLTKQAKVQAKEARNQVRTRILTVTG